MLKIKIIPKIKWLLKADDLTRIHHDLVWTKEESVVLCDTVESKYNRHHSGKC